MDSDKGRKVPPLDYALPDVPPSRSRVILGTALGFGAFVLWGLFELQRMPYRPPQDMSTFLGGPEVVAVRLIMGILGIFWVVGLLWFIISRRPRWPRADGAGAASQDRRKRPGVGGGPAGGHD